MEFIAIKKEEYQELQSTLQEIKRSLANFKHTQTLSEQWLDNADVCKLLNVSKRTLQHYRDSGKLPYSQIGAKIYFKVHDVEQFLNDNYKSKSSKDK
jgi:excisionase family DNA binding protein